MSALDEILDDYEALAEAVRRLEQSRGHHEGDHEFCCERGRCVKCEEARIQVEGKLHQALLKVEPRPFHLRSTQRVPPRPKMQSGSVQVPEEKIKKLRSTAGEYLRSFFTELEKLKHPEICDVAHAIGFPDERLCVLVSVGDFRERVYVDDWDEDPLSAARKVFELWQSKIHRDEDIE